MRKTAAGFYAKRGKNDPVFVKELIFPVPVDDFCIMFYYGTIRGLRSEARIT